MHPPTCTIDSKILNKDSLSDMNDIALSFFASACGKNRGAFVVDPPDGNTYGCLHFPENLAELAGLPDFPDNVTIDEANAIKKQYEGGNITATDTLGILEFLVESVYHSTPDKADSPYACEFNGLAELSCDIKARSPRTDGKPIRSVTLAGMFVDALWATGGKPLTLKEMSKWYTYEDFEDMKKLGLNTVQILVPTAAFVAGDDHGAKIWRIMDRLLDDIDAAGLDAVLALVGTGDELDAVVASASYATTKDNVIAVTLPPKTLIDVKTMVDAVRVEAPDLPLFVPMGIGDLIKMNGEFDKNVYGSLGMSHTAAVAEIASSTSQEDRSKLFYHEATSCMARSPMEFAACYRSMPIFLSSGFDLAIDDCVNKDIVSTFNDYGQCDRFDETTNSGWWFRHRTSFADRQLYAYERGLGWSFAAWKIYGDENPGVIDSPEKLLSLKDVSAAGLFPNLDAKIPAREACLNPPENDFAMGDDTLAPTMAPPPDCGNGWWNYTINDCTYWIPPPETPEPTPAPTVGCPVCDNCTITAAATTSATGSHILSSGNIFGVVIGAVLGGIAVKLFSGKRNDYERIPN